MFKGLINRFYKRFGGFGVQGSFIIQSAPITAPRTDVLVMAGLLGFWFGFWAFGFGFRRQGFGPTLGLGSRRP